MERVHLQLLENYPLREEVAHAAQSVQGLTKQTSSHGRKSPRAFIHGHRKVWDNVTNQNVSQMHIDQHKALTRSNITQVVKDVNTCLKAHQEQLHGSLEELNERIEAEKMRQEHALKSRLAALEAEERDLRVELGNGGGSVEELEAEYEELEMKLRLLSRADRRRDKAKNLAKKIDRLERKLLREKGRLASSDDFLERQLPLKRMEFSKKITDLRVAISDVVSNIECYQRNLVLLEESEVETRLLATIVIQACFRGYLVRRTVKQFSLDVSHVQLAGRLLAKKLYLHLPLITTILLVRDKSHHALAPELTCRHCYQTFRDPVWLMVGPNQRSTFCRECASSLVQRGKNNAQRRKTANLNSLIQNQTILTLADRLEQKRRRFEDVCRHIEDLKGECILHHEFNTLISALPNNTDLANRISDRDIILSTKTKKK